jgi:hypothetical protein
MINPIDLLARAGVFDECLFVDRGNLPTMEFAVIPGESQSFLYEMPKNIDLRPGSISYVIRYSDLDHMAMCQVEGRKPIDEARQ